MGITLKGSYDLHVHTSPDIIPRKLSDEEMVQRAASAGMRGCVLKCHAAPTMGQAVNLGKRYPQVDVIGSITLNRSVGGINPAAVEAAGKMGARYVWFPTMDARAYRKEQGKPYEDALSVCGTDGEVTEETKEVLRLAKKYDMVVGTGHIGTEDAMKLVQTAHCMGLKRICLTHVSLPVCRMTCAQLDESIALGAWVEYSYCHILSGKCEPDLVAEQIRHIGAEHVVLSSDLGQIDNPYPDEGLLEFARLLNGLGISEEELSLMLVKTPWELLYA